MSETKLNSIVTSSPYKKKWIAGQLGITPTQFSNILKRPDLLYKDKLKLEKLCQLLNKSPSEIRE